MASALFGSPVRHRCVVLAVADRLARRSRAGSPAHPFSVGTELGQLAIATFWFLQGDRQ